MNFVSRKAAIVGVHEYPLRRAPGATSQQIQMECAKNALEDAGLNKDDVDAYFTAGLTIDDILVTAEYLGIRPTYVDSTWTGGPSFISHLGHAAVAIAAGVCKVALITYGSTALSEMVSIGTGGTQKEIKGPNNFELPYGQTVVGCYAMAAQRHAYQFGSTDAQRAEISVATRKWASLNPQAMYRKPLTVEDVLNSRMICSPLRFLECCVISDGGGAVVVTSSDKAKDLRRKPVYLLGWGEALSHGTVISQMRDFTDNGSGISGGKAFEMAGLKPQDIDVAEIYDSFTITTMLSLEGLGFCPKGEGGHFVSGQRTAPGGDFPMNTDGGGLSSNHPGMRGIFLIIEAVRQLRGECATRQVPNAKLALVHGTGVYLSSSATAILSNE
jgi:acetyl-CoA acetyltransferase